MLKMLLPCAAPLLLLLLASPPGVHTELHVKMLEPNEDDDEATTLKNWVEQGEYWTERHRAPDSAWMQVLCGLLVGVSLGLLKGVTPWLLWQE